MHTTLYRAFPHMGKAIFLPSKQPNQGIIMRATTTTLILLLAAGLLQPLAAQSTQDASQFLFTADTQVFIDGTSSLHDWTCDVKKTTGSFAATLTEDGSAFSVESGDVAINVEDIECGKGTMNKKLKAALTINDATNISYALESVTTTALGDGAFEMALNGSLTIAGSTKPISMVATGTQADGQIRFEGSTSLLQTDYGVDPPTALLGRLKTGDEVTIRFVVIAK